MAKSNRSNTSSVNGTDSTIVAPENSSNIQSNASLINAQETNNTMQTINNNLSVGSFINTVRGERTAPTMTVKQVLDLNLLDRVSVIDDLHQDESGAWRLNWHQPGMDRLDETAPEIIMTTNAKRYERLLNVRGERPHFINLRTSGRAVAMPAYWHVGPVDQSVIDEFPQLQGAEEVVAFALKANPTVQRFVFFPENPLERPTTYKLMVRTNTTITGRKYVMEGGRYLARHDVHAAVKAEVERWNKIAAERGLSPIDPNSCASKFELAAFVALGFSLIFEFPFRKQVEGEWVDRATGEIKTGMRPEWNEEMRNRLIHGDGEGKAKVAHLTDGFQRETAQHAGLRREHFIAFETENEAAAAALDAE